ncbi:MAG TPA: acyltransferase [Polyangia bacterium]|nr:acyltransferase [Polyangia bacterium]
MEAANRGRIPSLDGLRAGSILLVLFGHLSGTAHFPHFVDSGVLAIFGVRVFFVISGFLITSLLLAEEGSTGTISLRRFYLRRTMRIFPPFYFYVAIVAAMAALGWIELRRFDLLAALTYTTNYHHERSWYLGHAWSLAVEEQFYLLWPFLMKYLGARRAARVAWGAVLGAPLIRIGLLVGAPAFRVGIGETFPTVSDAIATGCLLATYHARIAEAPRLLAFLRGRRFWLAPAIALLAAASPSAKFDCLVGQTISNLGVALLVERAVRFPEDVSGRLLNWRPVVFVGMLSYSLYLWQQPFLDRHASLAINAFPLNIALVFAAALISYTFIERPALRWRAWIERQRRVGRRRAIGATAIGAGKTPAVAPEIVKGWGSGRPPTPGL